MSWLTSLVFTESVTYYNTTEDFGQVKLEKTEIEYQDREISTLPTDNIKKNQIPRPLHLAF